MTPKKYFFPYSGPRSSNTIALNSLERYKGKRSHREWKVVQKMSFNQTTEETLATIRTHVSQGWDWPPSKQTCRPLTWSPLTFTPGITVCCVVWNVMKKKEQKNVDWWKDQKGRRKRWERQKLNDGTVCGKHKRRGLRPSGMKLMMIEHKDVLGW